MPGPIEATGAVRNPTRYGALTMGSRAITGLWTQRSPYRDADVEYLISKFYQGSRFDSILDGLNREISSNLTDVRRPGMDAFSDTAPGAVRSFYSWKYIQSGKEIIEVLADTDNSVYSIYSYFGINGLLYTPSVAAGPFRFCGVNTELFITDGNAPKKILRSAKTWNATTTYTVGDFIIDTHGNLQVFTTQQIAPAITNLEGVQLGTSAAGTVRSGVIITFGSAAPVIPSNQYVTFAGITDASWTFLNGTLHVYNNPMADDLAEIGGLTPDQILLVGTGGAIASTPISAGTMTTYIQEDDSGDPITGVSGSSTPAWSTSHGVQTQDGAIGTGVTWMCFGSPTQNWQVPAPAQPLWKTNPPFTSLTDQYWPPGYGSSLGYTIIDTNGFLQVLLNSGLAGSVMPNWNTTLGGLTQDGKTQWKNVGQLSSWYPSYQYGIPIVAIIDTNGNLQVTTDYFITQTIWTSGTANTTGNTDITGSTEPTWNTTLLGTTTDGSYTWTNYGPAQQLTAGALQYSYSYHSIDGSVTTAAPVSYIATPIVGLNGYFAISFTVPSSSDPSVDQIWLWRTAGGQPTLVFLDQIANIPSAGQSGSVFYDYRDVIQDTSVNGNKALNPFIPAPVADEADPPPANMVAPVYYLSRIWGIVDNVVVYSGGPDIVTGNGNTAFSPLNEIPFAAQPIRLIPVTVQNGGLIVLTTDGAWIILGTGTSSNPFYVTPYYASVSISGYNAVDVYNNAIYLMESNARVSSLAIEYPFNPQTGYTEIGFPIGDQFINTTTGGTAPTPGYDPATAYVSWCVADTTDTALYVSDGAIGWFRMSFLNRPESGIVWSPRAAIGGGTSAVQCIEYKSGVFALAAGPASTGYTRIRQRPLSINYGDYGPGAYPAWDVKGVILLCSTGQWAEVAHISAKSSIYKVSLSAQSNRPAISVLMNEVAASTKRPWNLLSLDEKTNDPPLSAPSESVYSDRYDLQQDNFPNTGDSIQVRFDYGTSAIKDELLDWALYASLQDERQEPVETPR